MNYQETLEHLTKFTNDCTSITQLISMINDDEIDEADKHKLLEQLTTQYDSVNQVQELVDEILSYLNGINGFITQLEYHTRMNKHHTNTTKNLKYNIDTINRLVKQLIIQYGDKDSKGNYHLGTQNYPDLRLQNSSTYKIVINDDYKGELPEKYLKELKPSDMLSVSAIKDDIKHNPELLDELVSIGMIQVINTPLSLRGC